MLLLLALGSAVSTSHSTDALVACVSDVEISNLIEADAGGTVQLGAFCGAAITGEAAYAIASNDFGGMACQIQAAHPIATSLGKTQNSGRGESQA